MKADEARPYIAAYGLLRKGGKVALLLREGTGWKDGWYSLPAGKVDAGESFSATAIRELKEEIGIDVQLADMRAFLTMHRFEQKSDKQEWIDVFFEVSKWQGEPYNAEPDKHGELAWFELVELPDNIIPSVRFALNKIAAGERYIEYGWENSTR